MRRILPSTIVIGLMLLTVAASWAAQPLRPFDEREGQWTQMPWLTMSDGSGMRATPDEAIIAGADYLQAMQADVTEDLAGNGYTGIDEDPNDPDDAGWDWRGHIPTRSIPPHDGHQLEESLRGHGTGALLRLSGHVRSGLPHGDDGCR